jgi:predicted metal-dependent enzyme (double-stranded beta helix superfamily)
MTDTTPLRNFVQDMTRLVAAAGTDEPRILNEGGRMLAELVARDTWLPDAYAQPNPERYQQYLLYCDPFERFSVVSFVWGPGQLTPVHDHMVWGLIGMLRGAELEMRYVRADDGSLRDAGQSRLEPGRVQAVSPRIGDVHAVANALDDRASISIHVYGANIGRVRRHVFEPASGAARDFISGYANDALPNLWSAVG